MRVVLPWIVCAACALMLLAGCAGQTTDPRQGGLFSYNPQAYQERLDQRQQQLGDLERANSEAEQEQVRLDEEKTELAKQNRQLTAALGELEGSIKATTVKTSRQKAEQQRILAEIEEIQAATRANADLEDTAAKQQELERLRKRRDQLEKEAAALMLL